MSLSEAVAVMMRFHNQDAAAPEGQKPHMTRREAEALARIITDANLTLETLTRGDRRAGRRG